MHQSYRDLTVWSDSVSLAVEIYRLTAKFPVEERYGLTSQMRRASVSIASNIAEGQGRSTAGERRIFFGHARGSLCGLETGLELARLLEFTSPDRTDALLWVCAGIRRGLGRLIRDS